MVEGQRFGLLVAVRPTAERVRGSVVWRCSCDCGGTVLRSAKNLKSGDARSCGCLRLAYFAKRRERALRRLSDPTAPTWGLTSEGYVRTQIAGESVLQHRFLMERQLGRKLLSTESVHHKNGDRADNRLENLELWSSSHPSGQRAKDKLAWAKEIVALYEGLDL